MARQLLIVDDDPLSREVLALVAAEAGFHAATFDSGEAALAHLALHPGLAPSAILVDMQMPGLAGDPLARRLQAACGAATFLIAMSGSPVPPSMRTCFRSFLLKPFNFDEFLANLAGAPESADTHRFAEVPPSAAPAILDDATYTSLGRSMSRDQVRALFAMCLDDAERRLAQMRKAAADHDEDTYKRTAHAIKGSCGMVGALELASIASAMEELGPPPVHAPVDHLDPFSQFEAAALRLRSMLEAQSSN